MKRVFAFLVGTALLLGTSVRAQPPAPKPGAEHEKLKAYEGKWKAKVKFGDKESTGVMSLKMDLGGLWLISHYKDDSGFFSGRGLDSYDPVTKKYISVWVDSMSTLPMTLTGGFDKAGKKMIMTGETRGMDGKKVKMKTASEMTDRDHLVYSMYTVGADAKESLLMTIHYERIKK